MIQLLLLATLYASTDFPPEVQKIYETKCNTCHSGEMPTALIKDEASKKYFEKVVKKASKHFISTTYPFKSKHTMEEIRKETVKMISKGKMPPKKFLEKHPEFTLTEEEKVILLTWAKFE